MSAIVKDVMTTTVVSVRQDARFKEIINVMRRRHVSAFPVLDSANRVLGVISEADLLLKEAFPPGPEEARSPYLWRDRAKVAGLTAAELMTSPAITIEPECPVEEAARVMHRRRVKRMPVVTGQGRLVGIVSRVDVLGLYDRADADIRAEIIHQLAEVFRLEPGTITVQVVSGIVTLTGVAESRPLAMNVLDTIWHIDGVVDVRDRLQYPRSGHAADIRGE